MSNFNDKPLCEIYPDATEDQLWHIGAAVSVMADYPEIFANVPMRKVVSMFMTEEQEARAKEMELNDKRIRDI